MGNMAKAVKIKFIELGAGGILYLAALYTAGDGEWTSGAETACFCWLILRWRLAFSHS